jgi:cyclopropane fatty-acyl-phospholipid synthase-like methyltransferase
MQAVRINTPFVTTPPDIVDSMLKLAEIRKGDVLYDLGSGDGRIVIAAAKKYGVRGVGIELNPEHVKEAREEASRAGVSELARFEVGDVFDADLRPASVVTMYLLPEVNLELRPKLKRELRSGSRIVTHSFHMGDWAPERVIEVRGTKIYRWIIP